MRLETDSLGNCQFEAVLKTAGLKMSPWNFRQEVCDEMETLGIYPSDFIAKMRGNGIYGNIATLMTITSKLKQPILLVKNGPEDESTEHINPPGQPPVEGWLSPLLLAYNNNRHYETTAPCES